MTRDWEVRALVGSEDRQERQDRHGKRGDMGDVRDRGGREY